MGARDDRAGAGDRPAAELAGLDWEARNTRRSVVIDLPPTFAPRSLRRLLSLVAGVLALSTGGYLRSRP